MALAKPIAPVINLNGTSAESLIAGYEAAYRALLRASEVVQQVMVHGRDFQTAPDGLYERAKKEQVGRLNRIRDMAGEFLALAEDVQGQVDARKR